MAQTSTLADLTACARRTTGDRPPPLVGCSLTLIDDHVYVFGGRLVPTRTMVSTLYSLSLRTLTWTLLWPPLPPSSNSPTTPTAATPPLLSTDGPAPRYFHSAEAWGRKIVIFGGEGYSEPEESTTNGEGGEEGADESPLCTLGDLCVWDVDAGAWESPEPTCAEGVEAPAPRYAHLGVVNSVVAEDGKTKSVLLIMGGQDIRNTYLKSMNVLDLDEMRWVRSSAWDRHIGTYRAVATSAKWSVIPGSPLPATASSRLANNVNGRDRGESTSSATGSFATANSHLDESQKQELKKGLVAGGEEAALGLAEGETLVQLSYSERPTSSASEPLLLFSNFNFTQVRRDLDVVTAPIHPDHPLDASSLSTLMAGSSLPPGLRFPTGTIIGRHLLIFGTFLSHAVNNFSIWALDLGEAGGAKLLEKAKAGEPLNWMRIDPGSVLSKGSWNRAVGWKNSVVVLGDRERDIATDYDHRQTNFAHVAFVDLEAFGVYQYPPRPLPPLAQSFGLLTLSQPFLADFELRCSDGVRLGCSRKLLEDRWTWFRNKMEDFKTRAKGMVAVQQKRIDAQNEFDLDASISEDLDPTRSPTSAKSSTTELRLTPRTLNLPEPSPVVQAFLQYLYTLTLCTPLQFDLPVLTALLVFARSYDEGNLRALCVHALHETLSSGQWSGAQVYEAATLGGCTALQIRALRVLMGSARSGAKPKATPPEPSNATSIEDPSSSRPAVPEKASARRASHVPPPGVLSSRGPASSHYQRHRSTQSSSASFPSSYSPSPSPTPTQYAFDPSLKTPPLPTNGFFGLPEHLSPLPSPSISRESSRSPARSPSLPSPSRSPQPGLARPFSASSSTSPQPTPDVVPPVPVPRWEMIPTSPRLPPPEPSRPSFASSRSTSTTGTIINSYGRDHEDDYFGQQEFGSPRSLSTAATSQQDGLSPKDTSPVGPFGRVADIGQVIHEEDEEEHGQHASTTLTPSSPLPIPHSFSTISLARTNKSSSKSSIFRSNSGSSTKEEWRPLLLDTVRASDLKAAQATVVSPEIVALAVSGRRPSIGSAHSNPVAIPMARDVSSSSISSGGSSLVSSFGPSTPGSLSRFDFHPAPSVHTTTGGGGGDSSGESIAGTSIRSGSSSTYSAPHTLTPTPSHLPPSSSSPTPFTPSPPLPAPTQLTKRSTFFTSSSSSSSSTTSTKAMTKEIREKVERELGEEVLRAAGASEKEIMLRARSVGHKVLLEQQEKEKLVRKLGAVGLDGVEFVGGVPLVSKFSIG